MSWQTDKDKTNNELSEYYKFSLEDLEFITIMLLIASVSYILSGLQ